MPQLQQLGKGVYGATDLFFPAEDFSVNAGFIIAKNTIIHVDAGMTVKDGEWLLNNSQREAGTKDATIKLVLSHHHSDHIFGMSIFKEAGAKVIAHENFRKFLSHRMLPLFKRTIDTYKPFIIKLMVKRASYTKEEAEKTLGDVKLSLPDEVFTEDRHLRIDDDEVLLLYTPGHVISEISIYHPRSKTLFAGDAVYEGSPLNTRFGGPKEWRQWIRSLEKLERLEIKNIVPGHGKICKKDEINRNIEYLEDLLNR